MRREINAPDTEPEQKSFKLPSEGVDHVFRVVEVLDEKSTDIVYVTKIEIAEGSERGRSLLLRVTVDPSSNVFFLGQFFLKAIKEPYKGDFAVDSDMWIGKTFVASVVHNVVTKKDADGKDVSKTYANIDQYNFDTVEEVAPPSCEPTPEELKAWDETEG